MCVLYGLILILWRVPASPKVAVTWARSAAEKSSASNLQIEPQLFSIKLTPAFTLFLFFRCMWMNVWYVWSVCVRACGMCGPCACVRVYVCSVCVCMHVCVWYMQVCVCCICKCVCGVFVYVCMYVYVWYMCVYDVCMYMWLCPCVWYVYMCIYVRVWYIHAFIVVYVCRVYVCDICMCMHVCMCWGFYVHICEDVCVCMFIYVRIYTCRWIMFICVKMYMYVGGFMFMYMSTCVCVDLQSHRSAFNAVPRELSTLFFWRQDLLLGRIWHSMFRLVVWQWAWAWVGHPPFYANTLCFLHGCQDLSSGLLACTANTLPTDPLPNQLLSGSLN